VIIVIVVKWILLDFFLETVRAAVGFELNDAPTPRVVCSVAGGPSWRHPQIGQPV
jgi:hypothetical protein